MDHPLFSSDGYPTQGVRGRFGRSTGGWLFAIALWLSAVAATPAAAQSAIQDQEERLLKAAFIYNFAKFTRWPRAVQEESPLTLCISGTDALVAELERLDGKRVGGAPLAIRLLQEGGDGSGCQLLYVAESERHRQAQILESLRGEPVLTVSCLSGFAPAGGVIELFREEGRVRFIINLRTARESGLELSSRLLRLGVVLGQQPAP
ncbi:MAG: YfiR family protein [Gammaproteobacteria bacterium]|nr:YfiR family protein [Gammaproteobacteria bacterium]